MGGIVLYVTFWGAVYLPNLMPFPFLMLKEKFERMCILSIILFWWGNIFFGWYVSILFLLHIKLTLMSPLCVLFSRQKTAFRSWFHEVFSDTPKSIFSQWRNWWRARGQAPPSKVNVRTEPPLVDILIFSILYFVVFCVLGVFLFFYLVWTSTTSRYSLSFLNLFLSFG